MWAALPDVVLSLDEAARDRRTIVGDENCALDDARFFLRGQLVVAAADGTKVAWSVWVELASRPAYKRALALWRDERRTTEPALAVTLANELPSFAGSLGLPGRLELGPRGRPAMLRLDDGAHALCVAQRDGISRSQADVLLKLAAG